MHASFIRQERVLEYDNSPSRAGIFVGVLCYTATQTAEYKQREQAISWVIKRFRVRHHAKWHYL